MKNYKLVNRIFGWVAFLIAAIVYISTIEPTTSFWDCGEFIASGYKLEIGHPPGAPTFMLMTRLASMFASAPTNVAKMVNTMSALASAFTIMFLFWTIAYFAKRIIAPDNKLNTAKIIAVIGASFVGAMVYTFSDTFWFSAVEGEVYASSSFFTAIVFWAMLRWEQAIDSKHAYRWILLIALLIGLSIGVHLLNLLAIPAMVFIYYFKKYKPTRKGVLGALAIAILILAILMYGVIPGVAKVSFKFDLLFVNNMGLPYYSGVFTWLILLLASLAGSIYFTQYKFNKNMGVACIVIGLILLGLPFMTNSAFLSILIIAAIAFGAWKLYDNYKPLLNTVMLAFIFILIGYSTFSIIIIRSLAEPPMDQNDPDNMYQFLTYLNREQYGDMPLFYGEYYNSERIAIEDTDPVYVRKNNKYEVVDYKKKIKYKKEHMTLLPRMWSNKPEHIQEYKSWTGISGDRLPTFGENLTFLFKYQIGWMYGRYFMWNFAGRQNDIQGHGNTVHGNWISGIPFIDNPRVGDQDKMPDYLKNKGHNKYYMLPLLLGLIGLFLHFKKQKHDAWIVLLLFIMTGIAIVFYLNQYPYQPRERDYAYAGSFYAFSIWIGLGTLGIYRLLQYIGKGPVMAGLATGLCLLVPLQMAAENWDDHDRSNRYVARDFAHNYLTSCLPNSILFTYGDNDTFPIWYAQEVEGYRTDVKVCCLPYVASNWYIDQMKMKTYEAEPMPFSFEQETYEPGARDISYLYEQPSYEGYQPISRIVDFIANDSKSKLKTRRGDVFYTYPTTKMILPVDSANAVESGIVKPEDAHLMEKEIRWDTKQEYMMKNQLMIFDLLANFDWKRPVYYTSVGRNETLNLKNYFQLDGFSYRLTPIKSNNSRIDTEVLYDNLMNNFDYGNIEDPGIYADYTIRRTVKIVQLRELFVRLANRLRNEGDTARAIEVLERCEKQIPIDVFTPDVFSTNLADAWYQLDKPEKGDEIISYIVSLYDKELRYHFSLPDNKIPGNSREIAMALQTIQDCYRMALRHQREDILPAIEASLQEHTPLFEQYFNYPQQQNRRQPQLQGI
ncbi:MAG: glycosyltransferase family 117 protein [Bacteroidales bacterium]